MGPLLGVCSGQLGRAQDYTATAQERVSWGEFRFNPCFVGEFTWVDITISNMCQPKRS
jgi:hypothetical protein